MEYKKGKNEKTGGFIPIGYKIEIVENNGKQIKTLVENKYEKDLIKEMLDLKAESKISYRKIGLILTERGFKNRNDSLNWTRDGVMKFLHPERNVKKKK